MRIGEPGTCNPGQLIEPQWRRAWRFLKKLGIKLPYDPEIPLLGIYPEETIIEKDTFLLFFFFF